MLGLGLRLELGSAKIEVLINTINPNLNLNIKEWENAVKKNHTHTQKKNRLKKQNCRYNYF
jgi:hypothetical protein